MDLVSFCYFLRRLRYGCLLSLTAEVFFTWFSPRAIFQVVSHFHLPHFYNSVCWFLGSVARWPGCRAALTGGSVGRRRRRTQGWRRTGSGQANVTRRRRFGAAGEVLVERQEVWRDTDPLAAFGGRPLRGGSGDCNYGGAWQVLWR